ncbi:hypothetical protein GCM10010339_77260 [Streptomyces alanosinicus]|uniref:Acyl-CoA carboxylase subunit epsilon n=1 Tax=Streptomyces alanosinicus TaxID=68171 RepID=A0A918YRH4_9ACTN|nr:hypothetical protein GCM10010339_77260 [Streptomyces alanosinicus]
MRQAASDALLRVERGHATAEELAAVTAVLLARLNRGRLPSAAGADRRRADPRPLDRVALFRAPHSWQRTAAATAG